MLAADWIKLPKVVEYKAHMSQYKRFIDLFDIVGPVMIGPSSSHTAGAAKIGYHAFQLLASHPNKIRIKLYNSFSDTGEGHKTDLAVLGGCLGIKPDDSQLIDAKKIAEQKSVDFKIKWGYHSSDLHPNTVIIDLESDQRKVGLVGYSIGGGRIRIAKTTVKDKPGADTTKLESQLRSTSKKTSPDSNLSSSKPTASNSDSDYLDFAQIKQAANTGKQMLKLALEIETIVADSSKQEILAEFERRWQIMVQSIEQGISSYERSASDTFGGDSYRIRRSKLNVLNQTVENGIFYAIGVAEHNAKMGKIVAAPTAGASGILPGVLRAMQQKFNFSDQQISEALVIASAVGAVIAHKVALAGAVAGCQAEIGAAGAMAAAAGVYLLAGDVSEIEAGASLVLANLLGLTCDPVMGRVEVPCILRNGAVTSMTFGAVEMALDNVKYTIPFDEVVEVMRTVGLDMDARYKETSQGGLAQTKTAKRLCTACGRCS